MYPSDSQKQQKLIPDLLPAFYHRYCVAFPHPEISDGEASSDFDGPGDPDRRRVQGTALSRRELRRYAWVLLWRRAGVAGPDGCHFSFQGSFIRKGPITAHLRELFCVLPASLPFPGTALHFLCSWAAAGLPWRALCLSTFLQ